MLEGTEVAARTPAWVVDDEVRERVQDALAVDQAPISTITPSASGC
ncbi:MAG: hypothetical protein R3B82_02735 [Sandaracinaceae bacterium]